MKLLILSNILFFFLTLFYGCAQRHTIVIDPDLPITPRETAQFTPIGLRVDDSRATNIIARWNGSLNIRKFTISPDRDIREPIHSKIKQGLQMLGFHVKPLREGILPLLRVEILSLKSSYSGQIPHLNIRVQSAFRVSCKSQSQTYKKIYTDKRERRRVLPSSFPNELLVNSSFSSIFRKIFTDGKLLDCLAS